MKKTSFEKFIKSLTKNLKRVESKVLRETKKTIKSESKDIEQIESKRIFNGKTFDDKNIVPSYAPTTVKIKTQKGQPTNRVTLTDTGKWRKKLQLKVAANVQLVNESQITKFIEPKYNNILGLSSESKRFIVNSLIENVNPKLYELLLNRKYL